MASLMELRNHPKLPREALATGRFTGVGRTGRISVKWGVLRASEKSAIKPPGVCKDQDYFGSLSFDDDEFFKQICERFQGPHRGADLNNREPRY